MGNEQPQASVPPPSSGVDAVAHDMAGGGAAGELVLRVPTREDAADVLATIREAFGARPPVDPPADFLNDTLADIEGAIDACPCVVADWVVDGSREMAGCLLLRVQGPVASLHRVSVRPAHRRRGVAEAMVSGASDLATDLGARSLELFARREFPETLAWWRRHGFAPCAETDTGAILRRQLPVRVVVPDTEAMHALGRRLASVLRAGDVVIETGDLGAGKTTLTQGLGEGLQVGSPVTSPTFVLSRVHRSGAGLPALVHVDAYRLGSAAELEDIDLDATLPEAITVVEWGSGLAEGLSSSWLDVDIRRSTDPADETRTVYVTGNGGRWRGVDLWASLDAGGAGQDDGVGAEAPEGHDRA